MYKLHPLLLLMPKKTISLNAVYTGYKCGKKIEMSIRDSKKYEQMHYKVCSICRNGENGGEVQGIIDRHTGKIMVPVFEIK